MLPYLFHVFQGIRTIVPKKNWRRLGLEFGLELGVIFLGGNCPRVVFQDPCFQARGSRGSRFLRVHVFKSTDPGSES